MTHQELCTWIRREVLRTGFETGKMHYGGTSSCVEILVSLHYIIMNDDDQILIDKGHCARALHAIWLDKKLITQEQYDSYGKDGGFLGGQLIAGKPKCVQCSTGSLGNTLGIGIGIAYANRLDKKDGNIYILLSDGALQEGSIWEAADFAGRHQLTSITCIIDMNKLGATGSSNIQLSETTGLISRFESFGWYTNIVDGHDIQQIRGGVLNFHSDKPLLIVAKTTKGYGVRELEGKASSHHGTLSFDQYQKAIKELM